MGRASHGPLPSVCGTGAQVEDGDPARPPSAPPELSTSDLQPGEMWARRGEDTAPWAGRAPRRLTYTRCTGSWAQNGGA